MANNSTYNLDIFGKEHEGKAGKEYDVLATYRLEQLTTAANNFYYSIESNLKVSNQQIPLSQPLTITDNQSQSPNIDTARVSVNSALSSLQQVVDLRSK